MTAPTNRRMNGGNRRAPRFTEKLSIVMVVFAALGGFLVLIDPRFAGEILGQPFSLGSEGFSAELKGAVVTIMLIGGWTAVQKFWLDASASGLTQSETMARIAEQSAPVAAAAAAAAISPVPGASIKTDTVSVAANVANVTENTEPKP